MAQFQSNPNNPSSSYSGGICYVHGAFIGFTCPYCTTTAPSLKPNITYSTVLTEDAIAAMVKAFDLIINGLREQIAERDRQLEELQEKYDLLHQQVANFTNRA